MPTVAIPQLGFLADLEHFQIQSGRELDSAVVLGSFTAVLVFVVVNLAIFAAAILLSYMRHDVDNDEKVQQLLPLLDEMVPEGLVTMEKVRVLRYRTHRPGD